MLQFINSFDQSTQGNTTLAKFYLNAFVWGIWHERNERIFKGQRRDRSHSFQHILWQVRSKAMFLYLILSPSIASAWDIQPRNASNRSSTFTI